MNGWAKLRTHGKREGQVAGVDGVPGALDEGRSHALEAARDRPVGGIAVVVDVLAVERLGVRRGRRGAPAPENRRERQGGTRGTIRHRLLLRETCTRPRRPRAVKARDAETARG